MVLLAIAGASYLAKQQGWISDDARPGGGGAAPTSDRRDATPPRATPTDETHLPSAAPPSAAADENDLAALIRSRQSDVVVETSGTVSRTLPDDDDGSRHQRFIVRVGDDTVLIAHNIDLAPRVPLKVGDAVRFKGEYEWNDRGGVIHWTHRDPQRRRPGGWIELRGKRYE